MEFLVEYGMFLAKAITIIASFGAVLVMIVSASHRKVSVDDKGEPVSYTHLTLPTNSNV